MSNLNQQQIELRSISLERRSEDNVLRELYGHAAVFNARSELLYGEFYEVISPNAFDTWLSSESDAAALVNHNRDSILARRNAKTLRLGKDEKGLTISIDIPDTTLGRDTAYMVNRGDLQYMSFGFVTHKDTWVMVDGVPQRTILDASVREVSVVPFPAYKTTDVAVRSAETHRRKSPAGYTLEVYRRQLQLAELNTY